MKALLTTAALLACLIAVPQGACAQTRKQIVAGEVAVMHDGISGSFEVREASSGIASTGTGGACLVFSEQSDGRSDCKTDSDCTLDPPFAGGYAYCLRQAGDSAKQGKCWVRPSGNYCLRSPTVPYPLDTKIAFPVAAAGNLEPVSKPLPGWWRVHACLNGKVNSTCGDVANPDKLISDGPPTRIP